MTQTTVLCRYCERQRAWPCMNTRDMEDFAIDGDPICYATLEAHGGGEKGMRYVTLNRNAKRDGAASNGNINNGQ
jgi:hypothetical protein